MSKRPRTSTGEGSSSGALLDESKFISYKAYERYRTRVLEKSIIPQRGFKDAGTTIEGQIASRGWEALTTRPIPAVANVVREFYANAKEHSNKKVFVRGKQVSFKAKAINEYYNLPEVDDSAFQQLRTAPPADEILQVLTENSVSWKYSADGAEVLAFPSSGLGSVTQAWHNFISANLIPAKHTTQVSRERAIINFAIQEGVAINVGSIIEKAILDILEEKTTGSLGLPSLIYGLCISKNVPISDNEEVIHPVADMTKELIKRYRRHAADSPTPVRRISMQQQGSASTSARTQPHQLPSSSQTQKDMAKILQQQQTILKRLDQMVKRQDEQFVYLTEAIRACHQPGVHSTMFPLFPNLGPFPPTAANRPATSADVRRAQDQAAIIQSVIDMLKANNESIAGLNIDNIPIPPRRQPGTSEQDTETQSQSASDKSVKEPEEADNEAEAATSDSESDDESADSEE